MILTILSAFIATFATAQSSHAALIVSGSGGYWNYRHQADAAAAYNLLIDNGLTADDIIYMSFDDVPTHVENPHNNSLWLDQYSGNIYNASNVDYRTYDVTARNFFSALTGDTNYASGPVLNTNESSKIFVYLVGHGAPGLFSLPLENIYADEMATALKWMHKHKKYDEMVIYVESCNAGSLFSSVNFTEVTGIYVATATDETGWAWAYSCPLDDDAIYGAHLNVCLRDYWSYLWMSDTENNGF